MAWIHAYGNAAGSNAPYKSALNGHLHKKVPGGLHSGGIWNLNDRGFISGSASETHIGINNPIDLPIIRGRPHGDGIL
jgi:hypothetical protein